MNEEYKYGVLQDWAEAAKRAAHYRELETNLRKQVVSLFFVASEGTEGTHTIPLPAGWGLKVQFKLNRTIDRAALPAVIGALPEAFKDTIFRYTPELNVANYKKLPDDLKDLVDSALTIRPGTPSVELVPPKVVP